MNRATAAVHPPPLELRFDNGVPVLVLDETAAIDALRASVRAHMPTHAVTIAGRSTRIDLGAREVTLFDLRRIIHLLKQEHGVEITGLYLRSGAIHRFAERELKLKLFTTDAAPPAPRPLPARPARKERGLGIAEAEGTLDEADTEEVRFDGDEEEDGLAGLPDLVSAAVISEPTAELERLERLTLPHDIQANDLVDDPAIPARPAEPPAVLPPPPVDPGNSGVRSAVPPFGDESQAISAVAPPEGRPTTSLHRTLRSGAVVRFDGDLYVFGDVNPGAQIVATGNIVVLGALKGVAHAGAAGDEGAFIFAFDLRPTQLRIARKIAVPPARRSTAPPPPEVATVADGQITIEAYRGRIR